MNFGAINGWVNGTEQIVFDYEVTGSPVASVSTGDILNGDEDGWYTIIIHKVAISSSAGVQIRFNGDTGGNYGRRGITANSTTVANFSGTGEAFYNGVDGATNTDDFSVMKIYAKSGAVRFINSISTNRITGTTIGNIIPCTGVWNNAIHNLISMQFFDAGANFNIGTRIIILKSNNFTNGTPTGIINTPYIQKSWVRVASSVLGTAATTVTYTVDGDRDVVYAIKAAFKLGAATCSVGLRQNADTGNNYGHQYIRGSNTTLSASKSTGYPYGIIGYGNTGTYSMCDMFVFVKSGYVHPAVHTHALDVSGSAVWAADACSTVWSSTAATTSLTFYADQANGLAIGTQIDIYALRPNG